MANFPFFVKDMANPVLILILIPILLQHHTTYVVKLDQKILKIWGSETDL